jgi:N-acetylneuraminic acid mutarotase
MYNINRLLRFFVVAFVISANLLVISCGEDKIIDTGAPDMVVGRWFHSATLLNNGNVLVVGGESKFRTGTKTAEIFNTGSGLWESAGNTLEKRGEGHTATLLDNGNVLLVGGSEQVEIYNVSTGIFESTGSIEKARSWHAITKLSDGKVLIAGGQDPSSRKPKNTAEIYDPNTGQWTKTGDMQEQHTTDSMVLLADGKALIGGKKYSEVYNPSTGEWSSQSLVVKQRLGGYTLDKISDGTILMAGGGVLKGNQAGSIGGALASHDAFLVKTMKVESYNPDTATWMPANPLLMGMENHDSIHMKDGTLILVSASTAQKYDTTQGLWLALPDLLIERNYGHTATVLANGKVLIVGGNEGADPFNPATNNLMTGIARAEIYDPNAPMDK